MAAQSPLVGYNTNVRHKGKLYHIQTEDSGVSHPHVITHLFADGGRIIASRKTAYAEHLGAGAKELPSIVKKLMQEQHKAMFIELRDCVYDSEPPPASGPIETQPQVADALEQAQAAPAAAQVASAAHAKPRAVPAVAAAGEQPMAAGLSAAKARAASVAGIPAPIGRAGEPLAAAGVVPPVPPALAFGQAPPRPVGVSTPSQSGLLAPSGQLSSDDIETFERAAEARLLNSILGKSRSEAGKRGLGRYQQTVSAKPARAQRQPSRNIFGGEALRGKSLDEVILSYLSDDAGDTER